jgi:hypothetical protein
MDLSATSRLSSFTGHDSEQELPEEARYSPADLEAVVSLHANFSRRLEPFFKEDEFEEYTSSTNKKQLCDLSNSLAEIFGNLYGNHREERFKQMMYLYSFVDCFYIQKNHAKVISKLLNYAPSSEHEGSFWPCFFSLLKRGSLEEAVKKLRDHPKRADHPIFFTDLQRSLDIRNQLVTDQTDMRTEHDFITRFEELRRTATTKLTPATQARDLEEFRPLTLLLEGKLDDLGMEMTWLEYFLMRLLFVDGTYSSNSQTIPRILQSYSSKLDYFDKLLLGICRPETLHDALQTCMREYPKYFSAHVVEVLVMVYAIPIEPLEVLDDLSYPEYCFKAYVEDLIKHDEVSFEIPADYIINTLGRIRPEEILERTFITKLSRDLNIATGVLKYCRTHDAEACMETVYRYLYEAHRREENLHKAFYWGFRSNDKDFKRNIAGDLLAQAFSMDLLTLGQFVEKLDGEVFERSELPNFLKKYCEFNGHIEAGTPESLKKASSLLLEFLVQDNTPDIFVSRIIEEGMTLFQQNQVVITWR